MKREFPFSLAIAAAMTLHVLLGAVVKYQKILIAATPAARPPVTVRFVEVPPGAKTVQEKPDSKYFSDANRKAGALIPAATQRGRGAEERRSTGVEAPRSGGAKEQKGVTLPAIESPELGQDSSPSTRADGLSGALRNLDQYIGQDGGGGSPSQASADPGSGVFFDTQGFDLGPWANQVVAIVRRNWLVPVAAQLGLKGVVSVSFQVDRSGKILNPQVISSSRIVSYDQAALNALTASNPFPPLPADFPRPLLPAVFRFYYNTPVPN